MTLRRGTMSHKVLPLNQALFVVIATLFISSIANSVKTEMPRSTTGRGSHHPNTPSVTGDDVVKANSNFGQRGNENEAGNPQPIISNGLGNGAESDYSKHSQTADYGGYNMPADCTRGHCQNLDSFPDTSVNDFQYDDTGVVYTRPLLRPDSGLEKRRLRFIKRKLGDDEENPEAGPSPPEISGSLFIKSSVDVDDATKEKRRLRFVKKSDNENEDVMSHLDKRRLRFVKKDIGSDSSPKGKRRLRFVKKSERQDENENDMVDSLEKRRLRFIKRHLRSDVIQDKSSYLSNDRDVFNKPSGQYDLFYAFPDQNSESSFENINRGRERMAKSSYKDTDKSNDHHTIQKRSLHFQSALDDLSDNSNFELDSKKRNVGIARLQALIADKIRNEEIKKQMQKMIDIGKKRSLEMGLGSNTDSGVSLHSDDSLENLVAQSDLSKRNVGIARLQTLIAEKIREEQMKKEMRRMLHAGKKRSLESELDSSKDVDVSFYTGDSLSNELFQPDVSKRDLSVSRLQILIAKQIRDEQIRRQMEKNKKIGR